MLPREALKLIIGEMICNEFVLFVELSTEFEKFTDELPVKIMSPTNIMAD